MSVTANQALNELDKFPAFRRELADLLVLGQAYASDPKQFYCIGMIVEKAARLGSMLALRESMELSAVLDAQVVQQERAA
jgi:hypothetical protein